MATFFGEVNFVSSRACDDDDEEEACYIERFETAVRYNDSQNSAPQSSSLIVSFGLLSHEFLQNYIENAELKDMGEIQFVKVSNFKPEVSVDFHPRKLKPSRFYEASNGAVLCLSSLDTVPSVAHSLAKRILSLVEQSCPILLLCSYHYSKLNDGSQCEDRNQSVTYTVRSSTQLKAAYPPLPQPSTLDSLPAAIMTQCLLEERLCIIYAAFCESSLTGDVDLVAEPFTSALSLPPFSDFVSKEKLLDGRKTKSVRSDMCDRYT